MSHLCPLVYISEQILMICDIHNQYITTVMMSSLRWWYTRSISTRVLDGYQKDRKYSNKCLQYASGITLVGYPPNKYACSSTQTYYHCCCPNILVVALWAAQKANGHWIICSRSRIKSTICTVDTRRLALD